MNRLLYFCIREAVHALDAEGEFVPAIHPEVGVQPELDDARSCRMGKTPDFTCGWRDSQETNSQRIWKDFHVECKRLGEPTSATWKLNENYVRNGVWRFQDPEWRYGKDAWSGAMIGYVQGMDQETILDEVNNANRARSLEVIQPLASVQVGGFTQLEQVLTRPFPVSPFHLTHLWVDLRDVDADAS